MFKAFLNSVVIVPVLLAMLAATSRRARPRLTLLLGLVFTYNMLFLFALYYLRRRWLG